LNTAGVASRVGAAAKEKDMLRRIAGTLTGVVSVAVLMAGVVLLKYAYVAEHLALR
jgi:hypothetical protein